MEEVVVELPLQPFLLPDVLVSAQALLPVLQSLLLQKCQLTELPL